VVVIKDITERKQAANEQARLEEQLRQAQKMESIGRLAGGVAHDFNNQLTIIHLYSDLMRAGMAKNDPLLAKLERIRKASERATDLTQQLLAFSRKQILQPVILNLNELVTNLQKMLARLIGEDITLSTVLEPGLWPIMADRGQIEQVIMNLVVNARDAMPTGGLLTIETGNLIIDEQITSVHLDIPPGPCVMLAVNDTGHGMDKATQNQIFEPFFTTKEVGKGTGLGLATVHGIVKQSGGAIYFYSEPGQGATFKIYLPASESETARLVGVEPTRLVQRGHETILLVEDEAALRELVRETLQEMGYTVLEAGNGREALDLADQHPASIDLLLADVVMPQMGGGELFQALIARRPNVKVLFMSGYMDNDVVRHGVLTAEMDFLSKPFTRSTLASKVREVLDKA
jgi:nitrogen-specific signal transduction histidine kinase/CheY-like chemotaxis protein